MSAYQTGEEAQMHAPSQTAAPTGRILIAEDEQTLAKGLRDALSHAGHDAEVVHDGPAALEAVQQREFDLLVLDLMLPGMNGLDVLRQMREQASRVLVLILTALTDEEHLLRGFQLGADDYMTKPFSARELLARVEAQFRRRALDSRPPRHLTLAPGLELDLSRLEVHRGDDVIRLTAREGDILDYLVRNRDRVVTREDLLQDVWQYRNASIETRTVDIHIVGLRRKIEPDPASPQLIQTVRGRGYRWFSE